MVMTSKSISGWMALLLLPAVANAVDITSLTAQPNRIEGQSVEISAAVSWAPGPIAVSPMIRVTRTVRATVAPAPIAATAVPTQIDLTFDAATGRYRGQFANLPFSTYFTTITATQTIRNYTVFPATTTTTQDTRGVQFSVGAPAGCFHFNQGASLQGWTVAGPFDGDSASNLAQDTLVPMWLSSAGFLSADAQDADGALVLPVPSSLFPDADLFQSGFYRLDLRSPALATNASWQGIRGLSLRLSHSLIDVQVQALLQVRRPDGTITFFRQVDAAGNPVFLPVPIQGYRTVIVDVTPPADHTVIGVHVRVFGPAGSVFFNERMLILDGVCPRR
jgi:hypothetical protein